MSRTPALRAQSLTSRNRRVLLKAGGTLLLSVMGPAPARAAQIVGVRVWPAEEYTRVTL
jgi:N-acetylmuramoyl-L-alanine amidase